jgi:serine/threonine-protein kinase
MASLLAELEGALEVEVARAGSTSGEATAVLDSVPEPRRRFLTRRRMSLAGILLVAVAAIAAILVAVLAGDEERRAGEAVASGGEVGIAGAGDFDPSPGDESELGEIVNLAIDGNPGTEWVSEHYDSDLFGGIKDGVGIYVEAEQPARTRTMGVSSAEPGWDAEVYGAPSGPPEELRGWGEPIGSITGAGTGAEIQLDATAENRFFLLWFTKLPASTDDPGRFRAEISEIDLID